MRQKIDVNAREEDGATALAWAAVRCNGEIASLLVKAGANPNLTNDQGIGPLYIAITNGSTDMVKLLLDCLADERVIFPLNHGEMMEDFNVVDKIVARHSSPF